MFYDTKKELLDLIKRQGSLSLDQAVRHTKLGKTALRGHILQLERDGYVTHETVRSGPGRPSMRYQLTKKGDRLFPSYESALIKGLIEFLKSRDDEETLKLFFEGFWNERFVKAKRRMNEASDNDPELRLKALAQMLEEEGFMPELKLDKKDKQLTVKECNCPFGEVIKETRLPCKLEAMFYRKLLNEQTRRTAHIAEGDSSCTYDIPMNEGWTIKGPS